MKELSFCKDIFINNESLLNFSLFAKYSIVKFLFKTIEISLVLMIVRHLDGKGFEEIKRI